MVFPYMRNCLLVIVLAGILAGSVSVKTQSVADIVTPEFFNGILDQADASCDGENFYSRAAFLEAVNSFPQFGTADDIRREIAAFFAHVTHETGPGQTIGFDGLNSPETVATDLVISFKTALWYWVNSVQPVISQGFGVTIRAINGVLSAMVETLLPFRPGLTTILNIVTSLVLIPDPISPARIVLLISCFGHFAPKKYIYVA
ncbi:hypothetical protein CRYUN_Cryun36dG0013400 [Craigia yunnanensis]